MISKDALTIPISPALLEAMSIPPAQAVDYFALFGVSRSLNDAGQIEQAVMDRSRTLRQWQSSPQYGSEVVALLKTLHRAAKILKDSRRRQTYLEELERIERGEQVSAADEFIGLVRAAMVDNQLTPDARKVLNEFVSTSGLDGGQAQRIIAQVREELKAKRAEAKEKPADDDGWTFRIAEQGEEGLALMLQGMAQSGELGGMTGPQLMSEAARYGVAPERAAQMIAESKKIEFKHLVRIAASNRALSDAQARILMAKSSAYGLDHAQAFEIISDYTLSAHDPEVVFANVKLAETFDQEEISQIVDSNSVMRHRENFFKVLVSNIPDWARNLVLLVLGMGTLIFAGMWVMENMDGSVGPEVVTQSPDTVAETPAPTEVPHAEGGGTAPAGGDSAGDATGGPALVSLPDPASGMLLIEPELPSDPPAFELAIGEVTCAQYQRFLRATLESAPTGWTPSGDYPAGQAEHPVTRVPWQRAKQYCEWFARQNGWPAESVTLPSQAEFQRATRFRGMRGLPSQPDYWSRTRLGDASATAPAMQTRWDKLFVPGRGQLYDLIGNVAEWGADQRADGQVVVLGGHFGQAAPGYNPLQPSWQLPDAALPNVGFRVARHPK